MRAVTVITASLILGVAAVPVLGTSATTGQPEPPAVAGDPVAVEIDPGTTEGKIPESGPEPARSPAVSTTACAGSTDLDLAPSAWTASAVTAPVAADGGAPCCAVCARFGHPCGTCSRVCGAGSCCVPVPR